MLDGVIDSAHAELTEAAPSQRSESVQLHNGDCLDVLPTLPDNSVDLVLTDPPYFKVKNLDWDKQWSKPKDFLEWLDIVLGEFHRVLKPNGSLYLFASPQMSAKVECLIGERFNVLNNIRWTKEAGWHQKQVVSDMRRYQNPWESIIFAEHIGSESYAKGEAGYGAKCDELRGFVFEPLRTYLSSERDRAGFTTRQVAENYQKKTGSRTVTGMAGHWFEKVQWTLPTEENYNWLRALFGSEYLRTEYEDLRTEYEDLRRPFNVTAQVPYTDVWTYETVKPYKGKHPCEKPYQMGVDIINASSREGGVVLDAFMGSGVFGQAAVDSGRKFIGIEQDEVHFNSASNRISALI